MQLPSSFFVLLCLACAPASAAEEPPSPLDVALERANTRLDLAERALAVARRPMWAVPDLRLVAVPRMTRADLERIEFYKKNLLLARKALLELLQQKRIDAASAALTASYEAPAFRP